VGTLSRAVEEIVEAIEESLAAGRVEEAADLFTSLDPPTALEVILRLGSSERRRRILASVPVDRLGNLLGVLSKLPDEVVYELASVKGVDDIVKILSKLPVDEVADVLPKLPPRVRVDVLRVLPQELSSEVLRVIKYHPESVGGIMTTQVPVFDARLAVGEAIETYIRKVKLGLYDTHNYVYAVDSEGRLVGYLDVKVLLTKPRDARLADCVERVRVYVEPTRDREEAARLAIAYDLLEVPVVDASGRFLGVVTLDDLLDVVVSEFTEDLLKYGGFIETVRGSYIAQKPLRLALKRVPMLVYLYLLNAITGSIVVGFEDVISRVAMLAAFMPMLADNSGNVGSQASALILRSLVTGEVRLSRTDVVRVLVKEFTTTTLMLAILAPIAFAIGFAIPYITTWNAGFALEIASVVTAALAVSCYVADVVGALLPILLAKLKVDPAVASAPVVTSIGDIVAVLTYFLIATELFRL
jgi:magnesium transporter